ncbi:MAG: YtxH domain-containing protein [Gemmatimonadota bacterium]|nr:YtxH domain-containing protein [Gemmatimonadota bacterium]MDH5759636.1 YtxH domain-containing protein [Gemmatimonadota bacterium]
MRDRDEGPYIVIDRGGGGGVGSFLMGALLGAGVALLFAPRSGEETQEDLKKRARHFRELAEDRMREAQRQLEDRMDGAREGVQARFDDVRSAVEAGRQAAHEAREELERKMEMSKAAYRAGVDAARQSVATDSASEDEDDED